MKGTLTTLLVVAGCAMALAQNKHNIFVDVGINNLGLAATYDRKLTRHLDIGAGVNIYNFNYQPYAKVRSAAYLDIRPYWMIGKKSMMFAFIDIGAAYNSRSLQDSTTIKPVNVYNALGLGYHYRINKRGMGPYVSAGMYGYFENVHSTRVNLHPRARDYSVLDASLVLSLGFKL